LRNIGTSSHPSRIRTASKSCDGCPPSKLSSADLKNPRFAAVAPAGLMLLLLLVVEVPVCELLLGCC
jgi:hypothetical protein